MELACFFLKTRESSSQGKGPLNQRKTKQTASPPLEQDPEGESLLKGCVSGDFSPHPGLAPADPQPQCSAICMQRAPLTLWAGFVANTRRPTHSLKQSGHFRQLQIAERGEGWNNTNKSLLSFFVPCSIVSALHAVSHAIPLTVLGHRYVNTLSPFDRRGN